MPGVDQVNVSSFDRLRADYDAAFARLRAEEGRLRFTPQQDLTAVAAALQRFDQAMASYRVSRGKLAGFLASVAATNHAEVQALAHRLWEQAGRPAGNPEEQWYKAEKVLRSRAAILSAGGGESQSAH